MRNKNITAITSSLISNKEISEIDRTKKVDETVPFIQVNTLQTDFTNFKNSTQSSIQETLFNGSDNTTENQKYNFQKPSQLVRRKILIYGDQYCLEFTKVLKTIDHFNNSEINECIKNIFHETKNEIVIPLFDTSNISNYKT